MLLDKLKGHFIMKVYQWLMLIDLYRDYTLAIHSGISVFD